MFEALRDAVDGLTVTPDGASLMELTGLIGRLQAHLQIAAHQFNQSGEWSADGAYSAAGWFAANTGLDKNTASRMLRTGSKLAQLPATREAALDGGLSIDHVALITRNLTSSLLPMFAEIEHELVPTLAVLPRSSRHRP